MMNLVKICQIDHSRAGVSEVGEYPEGAVGRRRIVLEEPVTIIAGIGSEKMKALGRVGIETVGDLLYYFPFRHNYREVKRLTDAVDGEEVTLGGKVMGQPGSRWYGKKRSRHTVKIDVEGVPVQLVWFNRAYLTSKLLPGTQVQVSGKWDAQRLQLTLEEVRFLCASGRDGEELPAKSSSSGMRQDAPFHPFQPVYSVLSPLTTQWMARTMEKALQQFLPEVPENLPASVREAYRLLGRREALYAAHFPISHEVRKQARRRLAYEEVFFYQLGLQMTRSRLARASRRPVSRMPREEVGRFIRSLPFSLTGDQRKVIEEILADMEAEKAMNRLLLGDVGSGKTVVAAVALLAQVKLGRQGAVMAPTEILAEQHLRTLTSFFAGWDVQVGLLTGSTPIRERKEVLGLLQTGLLDVVVGTHALIQEEITFANLGLVITDEQHRFGVKQRESLRRKGLTPDALFMTATPIPRTLAITLYGDMDLSVMEEMPAGRKPVQTHWVKPEAFPQVVDFLRRQVGEGCQAYVICPLIEESEKLDLQNAVDLHGKLKEMLPDVEVGLLHGRMLAKEKEQVMQAFYMGEIEVLVSTSVVEVGLHVPGATVMVIYDADRFGLAQLHQLRGRVGRGNRSATCFLVADPKSALGRQRMKVMIRTQDGFEIAEQDLRLRGPGDVLGVKQSGDIAFRLVDLTHDAVMIEYARKDAREWVEKEGFWNTSEGRVLYEELLRLGYLAEVPLA